MQGGEEGVEFVEVGALAGLLLLDGFDDPCEAVLEIERGEWDSSFFDDSVANVWLAATDSLRAD